MRKELTSGGIPWLRLADPSRVGRVLGTIALLLVLASVAGQLFKYTTGHGRVFGLIPLLDLDREQNLPTFYSTVLLVLASAIVAVIAALKREGRDAYARHWLFLAIIFFFMAIDETAGFHELTMHPMRSALGSAAEGALFFAWVVPGAVVVLVVALWYLRFVLHLPPRTRNLVIAAAAIFVGGALGVELLEGQYAVQHGQLNLGYSMIATVQEGMEMAGVVVFIYSMLAYLHDLAPRVLVEIGSNARPQA
jgi:hypothetical protein